MCQFIRKMIHSSLYQIFKERIFSVFFKIIKRHDPLSDTAVQILLQRTVLIGCPFYCPRQILRIDHQSFETVLHAIVTPSDLSALLELPPFIVMYLIAFIEITLQFKQEQLGVTVVSIISFTHIKIPNCKSAFCFLEISHLIPINDVFCFAFNKECNHCSAMGAYTNGTMPYPLHFHFMLTLGAIAVHVFSSAVAIEDISAFRHPLLMYPMFKVFWQRSDLSHFLVYGVYKTFMLFLKSLLHDPLLMQLDQLYRRPVISL